MKKCNRCLVEKSLDEFFKDKNHSSGRYSICKSCKKNQTYKWRKNNRETYNSVAREWRKNHKLSCREYNLRKKFGITNAQYSEMFNAQDGCCWICGRHQSQVKRRLAVDHCHKTNKIRKLLCSNCNKGLGNFKENPEFLRRAAIYLTQ